MAVIPALEARGLSFDYRLRGETLPVLRDVSLAVPAGGFHAVLGPSGSGKSTLLGILAGLDHPAGGQVLVDGRDVTGRLGAAAYMPQRDLLLPWKTVLDNVALGAEAGGTPRRAARELAMASLDRFGLGGFATVYPHALSGGMRQRAALLRTFLAHRDILLLDEPLGALDAMTRLDVQGWLAEVWAETHKTIVLVTHDIDEALFLADRITLLTARPGRVAGVIDVPLARPRSYAEAIAAPEFSELKREILRLLGHEIGVRA